MCDLEHKRIFECTFVSQRADLRPIGTEVARGELAQWKINVQNPRLVIGKFE